MIGRVEEALGTSGNRSNRRPISRVGGDALKEGPQVAAPEMARCPILICAFGRLRKCSVS